MWVMRTATLILLLATGCTTPGAAPAPSEAPSSSQPAAEPAKPATPAAVAVIIHKTGGFAGVNETLSVDAQGRWTRTARGTTRTGQLAPEQLARLATLAADQRLAAEASRPKSPGNCADAFVYAVTIQSTTVTFSDCGSQERPPATSALVQFLEEATA